MTPEGKVKAWAIRQYDQVFPGHTRISPRGGPFGQAGTGDHVLCWRSIYIMIEVKPYHDSQPTELQKIKLRRVQGSYGIAAVLKGKDHERLMAIRRAAMSIYVLIDQLVMELCKLGNENSDCVIRAKDLLSDRCGNEFQNR